MDKELIERLAVKAGFWIDRHKDNGACVDDRDGVCNEELTFFAALVAEECAKIAENTIVAHAAEFEPCHAAAEAIRAAFPKEPG